MDSTAHTGAERKSITSKSFFNAVIDSNFYRKQIHHQSCHEKASIVAERKLLLNTNIRTGDNEELGKARWSCKQHINKETIEGSGNAADELSKGCTRLTLNSTCNL